MEATKGMGWKICKQKRQSRNWKMKPNGTLNPYRMDTSIPLLDTTLEKR